MGWWSDADSRFETDREELPTYADVMPHSVTLGPTPPWIAELFPVVPCQDCGTQFLKSCNTCHPF